MPTMRDLTVRDSLTIVTIDGFDPPEGVNADDDADQYARTTDLPGSANYLIEAYGMSSNGDNPAFPPPGILWVDCEPMGYQVQSWRFAILIDSSEAEEIDLTAREAGYTVVSAEVVAEPNIFGDSSGHVEILNHRRGWVVIEG